MIELGDPHLPWLAIGTGAASSLVWLLVLLREAIAIRRHQERRRTPYLIMPLAAFIVSVGTLASAIGFAMQRGTVTIDINPDTLSLIASMGRGAMLAAGVIVLATLRPPKP